MEKLNRRDFAKKALGGGGLLTLITAFNFPESRLRSAVRK